MRWGLCQQIPARVSTLSASPPCRPAHVPVSAFAPDLVLRRHNDHHYEVTIDAEGIGQLAVGRGPCARARTTAPTLKVDRWLAGIDCHSPRLRHCQLPRPPGSCSRCRSISVYGVRQVAAYPAAAEQIDGASIANRTRLPMVRSPALPELGTRPHLKDRSGVSSQSPEDVSRPSPGLN